MPFQKSKRHQFNTLHHHRSWIPAQLRWPGCGPAERAQGLRMEPPIDAPHMKCMLATRQQCYHFPFHYWAQADSGRSHSVVLFASAIVFVSRQCIDRQLAEPGVARQCNGDGRGKPSRRWRRRQRWIGAVVTPTLAYEVVKKASNEAEEQDDAAVVFSEEPSQVGHGEGARRDYYSSIPCSQFSLHL
ncbi:hypothetical protein Cni_G17009 [Canna indica]|uniref:Uncharacterized protein n=1 Tax=Canna indica TaxID=4628 RepID=A0AAQ3KHP0_9LILI|nr:hypothetical protein Cni_G17009 [Canna indica]